MRAQLDARSFERRLRLTLGLPFAVLFVLASVLAALVLTLRSGAAEVAALNRALVLLRDSEGYFLDAAAAQREHLLAGDAASIQARRAALGELERHLDELGEHLAGEPAERARLASLAGGIAAWRARAESHAGEQAPGVRASGPATAAAPADPSEALRASFEDWTEHLRERRAAAEDLMSTRTARALLWTAAILAGAYVGTGWVAWRSMRRLGEQYRVAWNDVARQAELLEDANTRFETAVGVSDAVVYEWDVARDRAVLTGRVAEVLGHPYTGPVTVGWWHAQLHEDDRAQAMRDFDAALAACGRYTQEYRFRRADGRYATLLNRGVFVPGPDGRAERIVGLVEDVTAQREMARALEKAGRLESVGRLAGGIAHDFNNLTTAILGYAEIAGRAGAAPADVSAAAQAIRRAGTRAAGLTSQLLAFARREVVAPLVVELDQQVREALPLLRHGVGETVELEARLQAAGARVRVDPSRLESALVNLALNARDAMPRGGRLSIETAVVELSAEGVAQRPGLAPGPHARLVVRDTGEGMPPEVRARVFEPFFTTKPRGHGTGLGLPSVHGTVTQAGGHIAVDSEPGRGTTFEVLLPLADGAPEPRAPSVAEAPRGGDESVLLVEDDADVRALAAAALRRAGYRVSACASGAQAARQAADDAQRIDLLVTDVVMPGMGGRETAEAVARAQPAVRVLFTSGYAADVIAQNGVLEPGVNYLAKPYTPRALCAAARAALDRRPAS